MMKNKFLINTLLSVSLIFSGVSCNKNQNVSPDSNAFLSKTSSLKIDRNYKVNKILMPDTITDFDFNCTENGLYINSYESALENTFTIKCVDLENFSEKKITLKENVAFVNDICFTYDTMYISSEVYEENYNIVNCIFKIDTVTGEKISEIRLKEKSLNNSLMPYMYDSNIGVFDGTNLNLYTDTTEKLIFADSIDLTAFSGNNPINSVINDLSGNTYFVFQQNKNYYLTKLNKDFEHEYTVSGFDDMLSMPFLYHDADGNPVMCSQSPSEKYVYVNEINIADGSVSERFEIPSDPNPIFGHSLNNDYIFLQNGEIYMSDFEGNKIDNINIEPDITCKGFISDKHFYEFICDSIYQGNTLFKIDNTGTVKERYRYHDNTIFINSDSSYTLYNPQEKNISEYDTSYTKKSSVSLENIKEKYNDNYVLIGRTHNNIYSKSYDINLGTTLIYPPIYFVHDKNGKLEHTVEATNYADNVCEFIYDDTLYYVLNSDEKLSLYKLDDDLFVKVTDILENTETELVIASGDCVYDMYIINDNKIYGYNISDNILAEILSDIKSLGIGDICHVSIDQETGNMYCSVSQSENILYMLSPSDEYSQTEYINIAVMNYRYEELSKKALEYNDTNSETKITVTHYDNYKDLNFDISTGDIPDIIVSDNDFEIKEYIEKNTFIDLLPFINNDDQISYDDFIFKMNDENNHTYIVYPYFSLRTMLTDEETGIFTFDSFFNVADINDNKIFYAHDRTSLLHLILPHLVTEYVDIVNSTCNFSDGTFAKIIELINNQNCYNSFEKLPSPINDELCKFVIKDYNNFTEFQENTSLNICGFPGNEKSHNYINTDMCIGITNNCTSKEAAWEFIRQYFTEEYQQKIAQEQEHFPINKNAYETMLNVTKNNSSDNTEAEYADKINSAVYDAEIIWNMNNVYNIIDSETKEFFEGNIASQDVVQSIQSKIGLYLKEIS